MTRNKEINKHQSFHSNSCIKLFLYLIFLFAFSTIANSQALQRVKHFGKNPGFLKMYFHAPKKLNKNIAAPLVVVLHGCYQNAEIVADQTGWNKLADSLGFYLLYPEQRAFNNPIKCFCWYQSKDITKNKGENFSIKQMIEYVKTNYAINTKQIYVTGLSAGAAMSVAMLANYPETFNTGAIFAGAAYGAGTSIFSSLFAMLGLRNETPEDWAENIREQNPDYAGNYPKIIIYQGTWDPFVNRRNGFELVKQWTKLHHIDTIPSAHFDYFLNNPVIEKFSYKNNINENAVIYYRIKRLKHALLVHPGDCFTDGGNKGLFSSDRNFNSTYWTAVDFGLLALPEISGKPCVEENEKNIFYSVPYHAKSTYDWVFPKNCSLENINGTNSIILNWGVHAGCVNVTETDSLSCKTKYPTRCVNVISTK